MLLLYFCTYLYQIVAGKLMALLTGKHNMAYDTSRLKSPSCCALFSEELKICDFTIFAMTRTVIFLKLPIILVTQY